MNLGRQWSLHTIALAFRSLHHRLEYVALLHRVDGGLHHLARALEVPAFAMEWARCIERPEVIDMAECVGSPSGAFSSAAVCTLAAASISAARTADGEAPRSGPPSSSL